MVFTDHEEGLVEAVSPLSPTDAVIADRRQPVDRTEGTDERYERRRVSLVTTGESEPLEVGRRTRPVTRAQRGLASSSPLLAH